MRELYGVNVLIQVNNRYKEGFLQKNHRIGYFNTNWSDEEKMKALKALSALTLLTVSSSVMAEGTWKSAVELGLLLTEGNTETRSLNAKGAVAHESNKWRNEAKIEALNVSGKEGRLSEKYIANGKSSFKYSETSYSFISVDGVHDAFSGYAYQVSSALGYGHRVIGSKTTALDFEAGPGYRQTRLSGIEAIESELVLRLSGKYVHKLSKTSEFSEEIVSTLGEIKTITKSITAISARVVGNLSMKASLTIENNTNAPEGIKPTDLETAVTLVYSF